MLPTLFAQSFTYGLRGDSAAIADSRAMVDMMGGIEIWSQIQSLHFVHRWYPCYRVDTYTENEILDLTSSGSYVERKSEISYSIRAYSSFGKYWTVTDGKFAYGNDDLWLSSINRAPFNFYHLIRAIAIGDPFYEVKYGDGDIPNTRRLEFYGPDGNLGGWIILNAKKEPIVKATNDYRYTLGPLKQFGNIWVPAWGVYDNGLTRYEMISLTGSYQQPDSSLFLPPSKYLK